MADQAAGLRQWASSAQNSQDCPLHVVKMLQELALGKSSSPLARPSLPAVTPSGSSPTLMVVGLPGLSSRQAERVTETLAYWVESGWRWVGDPSRWKVVPVDATSPHLALLASQQSRWALWVDRDPEAFRRGYRVLKCLSDGVGPHRLLAVHAPGLGRRGLLENLQGAAADLGIDLLVLAR